MSEITRRRLLGTGAVAAGGAVASSLFPPNLRKALAAGPRAGSVRDIEHVVVLMQENRSFDHYFGTLAGVRGFADPDAITLSTGKSVFYQPAPTTTTVPGGYTNPDGYVLPWHLDTKTTSSQAIPSTSHAWQVQHEALNITLPSAAGQPTTAANDNWLPAHLAADGALHGPYTMSYYERDDIPFQFALAENFTLCDGYHASLLGPTWPNRMYLMTGMIDPEGTGGGPIYTNVVPSPFTGEPYTWTTYPEQLQDAGIYWKVYQEEDDYGTNPLEFFQQFQGAAPGSGLYERGLTISQPGKFEYDAAHDQLPTVSWIVPTSGQSEHPAYLPASGADFVASKLEAIAANPRLWNKTLFILNYDENDGLFDHVVPPTPPVGTAGEFVQVTAGGTTYPDWPIGGGFRVPCFLISPWTVGGWVATETFDHTSVLQLLEQVTGVRAANVTDWRRQTFGDLTSALGMGNGQRLAAPALPETRRDFWRAEYEVETLPAATLPGAAQTVPVQKKHRRVGWGGRPSTDGSNGAQTAGVGALRTSVSRITENRTSHRGDLPDGTKAAEGPGRLADLAGEPVGTGINAYVTAVSGGTSIIDTGSYTLTSALISETNAYGIAATPDGTKLYITESGANLVSAIEVAQLQTQSATSPPTPTSITVGVYPHGIAVSPDGARAYVANTGPGQGAGGSNTLSVIATATDTVTGSFTVGQSPQIVAVSPDSQRVYTTCLDGVWLSHAATGRGHLVCAGAPQAHGVTVSADGRWVWVADSLNDRVLVLDADNGHQVANTIAVGTYPWNVALTTDGTAAYVTNANSDTVSVIDVASGTVADTISVSRIPTGLATRDGEMWVTSNVSSTVNVIDTATRAVTQTVVIGISAEPVAIAFA